MKFFRKKETKSLSERLKTGYQIPGSLNNPVWPRCQEEETLTEEEIIEFRSQEDEAEAEERREERTRIETTVTMTSSFGMNQFKEKISDVEIAQKLKEFVKPKHLLDEMLSRVENGAISDLEKNFIADIATHCLLRDAQQEKDPTKKKEKLSRFESIRQNMSKK